MSALTPDKAKSLAGSHIPDNVLAIINEVLTSRLEVRETDDHRISKLSATVKQKDIEHAIIAALNVNVKHIYDQRWMDFEPIYKRAGWKVSYDRPGYNESYDATFEFKATVIMDDQPTTSNAMSPVQALK